MKLESLSIKGVLRFSDLLTIDFTQLPDGLIAFVGSNGGGKTTALETPPAAIYRSFPSRDEKELFDYAQDRDSYLETVISLDDRGQYRARVNLDGVRRVSEAVLVRVAPDGTTTVLNDGKVSTFDEAVAKVFPSREVLLASAFSAQNRAGSFLALDRKGRKQLFAQLLGLDHYEQMAQTARTAAGLAETSRGKLLAVRDLLARDCDSSQDAAIDATDRALAGETVTVESARGLLQGEIADVDARLATVQDQVAAFAVATQRVSSLEREWTSRHGEQRRLVDSRAAIDTTLAADRVRLEEALTKALLEHDTQATRSDRTRGDGLAAIDTRLTATLKDLAERVRNNRAVLETADEIRAAAARLVEVDAAIAMARTDEQTWRDQAGAIETLDRAVLVPALTVGQRGQADLTRAEQDTALLQTVPCGGAGKYSACSFLANAKAAQNQLAALREAAATLPATEERRRVAAADLQAARQQLALIGSTILGLEAEKKTLAAKAKLEPSIAAADARISELEQQQAEAADTAARARVEVEARAIARTTEIASQRQASQDQTAESLEDLEIRASSRRDTLAGDVAAIETAIQGLEQQLLAARADLAATEAGNQQAAQLQGMLAVLRGRWDATTREQARLEAGRQDVVRQRQALADRRADLADLEARLRTLATEIVEWQLLAKALGRDGLPNLEIDAAGPTVSAFANDLLSSCFGPRFSLELVTQEARADGKGMKEAFAIQVFDNERGGSARDIGDLSGGEQIIVAEALANAIALAANARNEHPIRTCWRDETTGPLDAKNAGRYVPMLRKLRELGGFGQVLFVSHNPEAAAQADAQVRFADGQAEILLPPYAA